MGLGMLKMNKEEWMDVMMQIKQICNEASDCRECIFF